jgi:IclR family pca regulon transcriptional regulator
VSTNAPRGWAARLAAGDFPSSPPDDESDRGRDFIQSLERGLAVIRCFTGEHPALSISEVAERTQVSRAAARRILFTLERLGYVGRTEAGLFRLQPAVLTLGYAYISGQHLPQVARPHMEMVAEELEGSCSLAVLEGSDVIFVARVKSRGYLATTLLVGSRLPAHITAMGRVLLADLPDDRIAEYLKNARLQAFTEKTLIDREKIKAAILEARRTGYSFIDQELEIGVRALAVPVLDRSGSVLAGLNVAVADPRQTSEFVLENHLPVLRRAAIGIASGLGPQ